MDQKTIEIIVNPDGSATIEAKGFKGEACLDATKAFEEALGSVGSRAEKPEMRLQDRAEAHAPRRAERPS